MQRLPLLDGWRAAAIISVLIGHFISAKGINFGRFGVELFFVLSGRLMADILFVQVAPIRQYFWRRISRVYPALLVFVICITALSQFWPGQEVSLASFLTAITFTYNYYRVGGHVTPIIDHVWTLCVEAHCYVVLGIIAFACRRWSVRPDIVVAVIAALMIINGLIQTVQGLDYYSVYWRTDVRGASILIGAVAYLWLRDRTLPALDRPVVLVGLLLGALVFNINAMPDPIKYGVGTPLLAIILAKAQSIPSFLKAAAGQKPVLLVATISYSLYLWQQPFFEIGSPLEQRLLLLIPVFLISYASFKLVEHPARLYLNRVLERKPSTA